MSATLFDVGPGDVATTTDDWYTPRWVFDAAGLVFDMDVCAPVDPAFRSCPAREYLTPVEDGLTAEWRGLVWMNPPYSGPAPWVERFASHPAGLALLPAYRGARWLGPLLRSADAIALVNVEFGLPNGKTNHTWSLSIVAARGEMCVSAAARIASADHLTSGAYHVRPVNRA